MKYPPEFNISEADLINNRGSFKCSSVSKLTIVSNLSLSILRSEQSVFLNSRFWFLYFPFANSTDSPEISIPRTEDAPEFEI